MGEPLAKISASRQDDSESCFLDHTIPRGFYLTSELDLSRMPSEQRPAIETSFRRLLESLNNVMKVEWEREDRKSLNKAANFFYPCRCLWFIVFGISVVGVFAVLIIDKSSIIILYLMGFLCLLIIVLFVLLCVFYCGCDTDEVDARVAEKIKPVVEMWNEENEVNGVSAAYKGVSFEFKGKHIVTIPDNLTLWKM